MFKQLRKFIWVALRRLYFYGQVRRQRGPLRLIVGAGKTRQNGWISSEIDSLDILVETHWEHYFSPASLDAILAEHVWEHLDEEQGIRAARLCFRYLKPGGYLRLAVPDGFHPSPDYIDYVKVGGRGPGANDHKVLYDHQTIQKMLNQAGFIVNPLEYFDRQGSFHAHSWDSTDGYIERSMAHDPRNSNGEPIYTSLIVDARKPE